MRRQISFESFYELGGSEWVSDGVQIGGLGSAIGIIGMWTRTECTDYNVEDGPIGSYYTLSLSAYLAAN